MTTKPIRTRSTIPIKIKHRNFDFITQWQTQKHLIILIGHQQRNRLINQIIVTAIIIHTKNRLKNFKHVHLNITRLDNNKVAILQKRNIF